MKSLIGHFSSGPDILYIPFRIRAQLTVVNSPGSIRAVVFLISLLDVCFEFALTNQNLYFCFLNQQNFFQTKKSTTLAESTKIENDQTKNNIATNTNPLLDDLDERLSVYKQVGEIARTEGNNGKVRRYGRIIKQYEEVIKLIRAGKTASLEELPIPPGFTQISKDITNPVFSPIRLSHEELSSKNDEQISLKTVVATELPNEATELTIEVKSDTTNLIQTLIDSRKEFKVAAIEAKHSGNIEKAKQYLLIFKKIENFLEAAYKGLPIDLNSVSFFFSINTDKNQSYFNLASHSTFAKNEFEKSKRGLNR